ncbi:FecR family protein [Winogradskyella sp. UBA3174]|uniref:FecR family protein n=1 Tax=Winogradskyella sp. UBA3174 TaxID=1947785 RepID=UPI0025FEEF45|nr:FecR family protein [Winogradskyella sp. UBA3174]
METENDILKWFNGEMSTEDFKKLHPNEDFSVLEKLGFYTKQFDVPNINAQEAFEDFKVKHFKKEETKVLSLNFKSFLKIAAILLIMLTSSYFVFFNNTRSYATKIAQTETLTLPDNSQVILNAKSSLSFSKKNWRSNRTLNLDGEAYFMVSKGEKFTVNTDAGSVQVLGTQFNIKERKNYFEVKCYEGSVSVTQNGKTTLLTLGKTFRVVNGDIVNIKDFNIKNPAWLTQESTFENVPLWQVIDELEIQYDMTITAKSIDTSKLFSGSFTHTDQNIALQSVTIPLNINYEIIDKQVEFYSYESN